MKMLQKMANVRAAHCIFPECTTQCVFGMKNDTMPKYCQEHAPPGAVDVKNPYCQFSGCGTQASFGFPNEPRTHCATHKLDGHVNRVVSHKRICQSVKCTTRATYGRPGDAMPSYCSHHAPDEYEDITNKRCEGPSCKTRANYGKPGTKTGTHCRKHAPKHFVKMNVKVCLTYGCDRPASYGMPNDKSPTFCSDHKTDGVHVNLKTKHMICKSEECDVTASFGKAGTKKALFCFEHAPKDFVSVSNAKCTHGGCTTIAIFGKPGDKQAVHCAKHHVEGEIDIKHPRCFFKTCDVRASLGIPGQKAVACAQHKKGGMILCPKRKCVVCKKVQAIFGVSEPLRCETHKDPSDLNLVHRDCVTCGATDILADDDQCGRCNMWFKKKLYCLKQQRIRDMLLAHKNFPKFDSYDRSVNMGECGRERPDFVWNTPTHQVVLEVDEHQHRERLCECEQTRMVNVTSSFGMPVFWIRFNPDNFKGIWSDLTDKIRHDTLRKTIKCCLKDAPKDTTDFCRVTYLFFDGAQRGEPLHIDRIPIL